MSGPNCPCLNCRIVDTINAYLETDHAEAEIKRAQKAKPAKSPLSAEDVEALVVAHSLGEVFANVLSEVETMEAKKVVVGNFMKGQNEMAAFIALKDGLSDAIGPTHGSA